MRNIKTWKRPKYPNEVDVRFAHFENDLAPGDAIDHAVAAITEGDMAIDDQGVLGNTVFVVLSGGTVKTVVQFTVTTRNNLTIIGEAIQPIVA